MENCSIILVDGIIEKVSEIHQILETASNEHRNVILIARKFFPDVCHTLSENFKNNNLNVIPYEAETHEYVDELESMGIYCIRFENYRNIAMVTLEDAQNSYDISIENNKLKISGLSQDILQRKCKVLIPTRYKDQSSIIEDRIKSGLCFSADVSKSGVVLDKNHNLLYGYKQYKIAKKATTSFRELIEKIGCVITHSR